MILLPNLPPSSVPANHPPSSEFSEVRSCTATLGLAPFSTLAPSPPLPPQALKVEHKADYVILAGYLKV